jgi:hypothetical protein
LIIDEIYICPIEHQGANLFFQLVSQRYGRRSDRHSNQSLGAGSGDGPFRRWVGRGIWRPGDLASAVRRQLFWPTH